MRPVIGIFSVNPTSLSTRSPGKYLQRVSLPWLTGKETRPSLRDSHERRREVV